MFSRLLLILSLWLSQSSWAGTISEYEMKATYLYNFAVFTEWPKSEGDTFNLCILGQDNFGTALNRIEGKIVHGRRLFVARLSSLSAIRRCDLLYITDRESTKLGVIFTELGDTPVLTVAETSPANTSAAINLALEGQRLVFDINVPRARNARLSISSKLLQLARSLQQ